MAKIGQRDWNRSSVDWEASREAGAFVLPLKRGEVAPPVTSIESQVYIDGGNKALSKYRREQSKAQKAKKSKKAT